MLDCRQLKHLRLLEELTQIEIAKELGITRNFISMVEGGQRKVSQEWHDKYVKTIYILSLRKKNNINVVKHVEEIAKEIEKQEVIPVIPKKKSLSRKKTK